MNIPAIAKHTVPQDDAEQKIQEALISNATSLNLTGFRLNHLPCSIGELKHLERLCLRHNDLMSLPESIGNLTRLQFLAVSSNNLKSLPDSIGNLTRLHTLEAANNDLRTLPASLGQLKSLTQLFLHGNKALGLPPEILGPRWHDEGAETTIIPAGDILDYYFRTQRGRRPINEAKLILVGRGGVGKTCLINRLIHNTFNANELETPGIEIRPWPVTLPHGDTVRLHVWDFGGQEILHSTHQFFLTERTLYLLVLSGREGNPTQDAEYWLQLIKSFGGDSRVLIALNKSSQHPFDVNRGLLFEKYPCIADFVKTDCHDTTGISDLKQRILHQTDTLEHRRAAFPTEWFSIKERLASMSENFVTWDHYQAICRDLGEPDVKSQHELAGFLHILGIALNYRDDTRLQDTHVLNPRWVTEGIYTLLRAGQRAKEQGVLTRTDLANVLDMERYPDHCHDFLLRLMEKFQLCFLLPNSTDQYLVPELLGENQPDLRELLSVPGLGFRYQYEVLPEGLLPRFIVQTHIYSEASLCWRTGVVLRLDGCVAVVRADARERRVDIHITGNAAQRRGLLAVIRARFHEQHRELKGLSVDERVPVPDEPGVTVSYSHLLRLEEDGEQEYHPEGMRGKVRVADLLNGVDWPEDRRERRPGLGTSYPPPTVMSARTVSPEQTRVFISYSHKDKKYLEELLVHLRPLQRMHLGAWSDQEIAPGSRWSEEVMAALATARVAVMMASPDFLASDFIVEQELGPLLKKAERDSVRILWIPLRHCLYNETLLRNYQPIGSPDRPLAAWSRPDRDRAWVQICDEIKRALTTKA